MEWKIIEKNPNYAISDTGLVKRLERYCTDSLGRKCHKKEKIFYPQKGVNGYMRSSIGMTREYTHRLVAEAFIPNPENLGTVDHIDGNKSNNAVTNLRWASLEDNIKFAAEKGLFSKPMREINKKNKQNYWNKNHVCLQISLIDETVIKEWSSPKEAAKTLHINYTSIIKCLSGDRNKAGGFAWKYKTIQEIVWPI